MLKGDYPITLLCDLLAVPRSSFYYRPAAADESQLREAINQLAAQFPTYGSRRLAAQLRRAPFQLEVNRKRVRRVMQELGLSCRPSEMNNHQCCNPCFYIPDDAKVFLKNHRSDKSRP
ncbi:MAG TPA: IS3 family transposase [Blastocatellia bacterium]|nr:IS3 family transposase [Blastocatellia bacterium]